MKNISWKTLVGLILVTAGVVCGILFDVPAVDITAIVATVIGATTTIMDTLMNDKISGWKAWLFVLLLVAGTSVMTIGGATASTITSVVGAVILIANVVFGIITVSKKDSK